MFFREENHYLDINRLKNASFISGTELNLRIKKIYFSILTNGKLIDSKVLHFFEKNSFHVRYSFDVYLKDDHSQIDFFNHSTEILKRLVDKKKISLSTNTVFTPDYVGEIYNSVRFLHHEGVKKIGIGIDQSSFWDKTSLKIFKEQLTRTADLVTAEYRRSGRIISDNFDPEKPSGINSCSAAGDRLTVAPDGGLWGCASFNYYDWDASEDSKENYYYGNIRNINDNGFEDNYKKVRNNYKKFKTDNFRSDESKCFLCEYLEECRICPTINYSTRNIRRTPLHIPEYICSLNKIINDVNREFRTGLRKS